MLVLNNTDLNWSYSDITPLPAVPVPTMAKNQRDKKTVGWVFSKDTALEHRRGSL